MSNRTMQELLLDELKDLYSADKKLGALAKHINPAAQRAG